MGRRTRVGSVTVGYLGVSWLILQVVDVVKDILPLPVWMAPGVLVLLGIGLVLVMATAWIQADPDTTRREQAGELPGDWQVAPREAWSSLLRGQLPHLTWGRTLLGGAVALSLLFGVAGAYVLFTDRPTAPPAAGADAAGASRIAAMPFTTNGPDLDVYREGMVELLATNLDGLGDIRAIASRTVLARWDERVGTVTRPDLDLVLETARVTGATHALVGSIVAAGEAVRMTAQLFDLGSGAELPVPRIEGPATGILKLVDDLSVSVARALLGSDEEVEATGSRLASLTTSSVPALRLYLEAEALYRRAAFADAVPLLDQALAADPSFGLAVMRRAQAFGWLTAIPADTLEAARLAIRQHLDALSQRDAVLAEGGIIDFADRDANGVRLLREFVVRYPEEAEGWYQLSDFLYHLNDIRGGRQEEVLGGFDRAVELGPRFAPYYIHAVEGAFLRADSARTRVLLDRYRELVGEDDRWQMWSLANTVVFGSDSAVPTGELASDAFGGGLARLTTMSDQPRIIADLTERYLEPADSRRVTAWLRAGRWTAIRTLASSLPTAVQATIQAKALSWAGAFGLERSQAALIWDGPITGTDPDFWTSDAGGMLERLLAARDDGTGADPVLTAHSAERAGDIELAETLMAEESWREYGPAMIYRLGKIYEATDRPAEALAAYESFLTLWSGADPDLPPVEHASDAVRRLGG